ncbi:MAG: DAK2 domain-containing protein [Erysipelotrichaceae bacterium]|nr:DAK2 domain-containing protein [Erysipelotrichaceae bacterium]
MKLLDGNTFKGMLKSASANLLNNKKRIDALNVFPVPDGDTGTNMSMTFESGAKAANEVYSDNLNEIARALSKGLLMGARGNSGVITSQIFRGIYQHLENNNLATVKEVSEAFVNGGVIAYKAIMKPVEGTILTVIREGADATNKYVDENPDIDIVEFFEKLVANMEIALNHTPDLLPVLKEVGVVDSGGAGLLTITEGMLAYLKGRPCEIDENIKDDYQSAALELNNDEFGYCTEFILRLSDDWLPIFDENKLRKALAEIGNSLVVVRDDDLVKVHVHTLHPGNALNIGQRYGEFIKLKIENMQEQHTAIEQGATSDATFATNNHMQMTKPKLKKYALIAVGAGRGIENLFREFRCDYIVSGGQTMNPSTEDFVAAIKSLYAEHIIILPNNSNIIMAAKQAKEVMDDYDIQVIETKSIQEGFAALSMFNPEDELQNNLDNMNEAYQAMATGSITFAIKDTSFEGVDIKEGDFIAMTSKKIIASNKDRLTTIKALIDKMADNDDKELMTIYVGEDGSLDEAEIIEAYINEHTEFEVEVVEGNQPVYSYLFGLE